MGFLERFEGFCGWLFFSFKDHEDKLLTKQAIFKDVPASIDVICEDAPEPNRLHEKHESLKDNIFPSLKWDVPADIAAKVKSYVVVIEDIDLPIPMVGLHGCFYNISKDAKSFSHDDYVNVRDRKGDAKFINNVRGVCYIGPRPLLNHGDHRYVYQVIALSTVIPDIQKLNELKNAMDGNILSFGTWYGSYRRDS